MTRPSSPSPPSTRRDLLRALAALPVLAASAGAGCGGDSSAANSPGAASPSGPTPEPTTPPAASTTPPSAGGPRLPNGAKHGTLRPTCGTLTSPSIEGPYFKPSSPERSSLVDANAVDSGTAPPRMILRGVVTGRDCAPIAGALVELWQADETGAYDNVGFHLRGHQFTDSNGAYTFETVVPGLYPGRTRHLHVKVQPKNGPTLTTQLYFPNDPGNAADGFFLPELVMAVSGLGSGSVAQATFDFVVEV